MILDRSTPGPQTGSSEESRPHHPASGCTTVVAVCFAFGRRQRHVLDEISLFKLRVHMYDFARFMS
jgi:hypothetical protein